MGETTPRASPNRRRYANKPGNPSNAVAPLRTRRWLTFSPNQFLVQNAYLNRIVL
ncbi:hypothetical protein H6G76_28665 [Nostoc sp. FACHB-152]|uniref:hypothetical protein n=1 Tax=unclassified Nostoc TaxID=2593658 RepID=UPI001685C7EB|nr:MULTISPECIES: hypothetical protein [unclassified Nostoc]MBD2451031.1 hypothetical protein [Nostoc sp. FACHB-152]MBD2472099.1 hypothetical protein [Nostoc sp. FACHB-145]